MPSPKDELMQAIQDDVVPNEPDDPWLKHLHIQRVIARALAAILYEVQQNQAEQTPISWRGYYVNLSTSKQILPRNGHRQKVKIYNDGPSDLFIADSLIPDPASTQAQYNGAQNQVMNVTIVRVNGDHEINSVGAVYGCPVNYGAAQDNSCQVRMVETLFASGNIRRPLGNRPPIDGSASKAAHEMSPFGTAGLR